MASLVFLVIAAGVALLAYRESENFRRNNGVTPWRIPSVVWAILGFLSLFICAILLVIARRTTKPAWGQQRSGSLQYTPMPAVAPPGWHPDPGNPTQWRYWDGRSWTDHVSRGTSTV